MTVSNVISVYKQASKTDKAEGKAWYKDAHQFCHGLGMHFGISIHTAAGVVAALSVRNKWDRNKYDAIRLLECLAEGGNVNNCNVCTFPAGKQKAITIASSNANPEQIANVLAGPKVREFFNCILLRNDVCIDGHAYSIWHGDRIPLAKTPSISKNLRTAIKTDYLIAATMLDIAPSELQATTWVTWRRLVL